MYESFFQLTKRPFDLTPNPGFLFLGKLHQQALSYLSYSLREHTGFMLLTGEVGTGKTTLLRELENTHLAGFSIAKIFNTKVDSAQLLRMICEDYGITTAGLDKPAMLQALYAHFIEQFAQKRPCVLIIDEAQNLTPDLLEELRLLSNIETDTHKLLRIILVGQPELTALLAKPELRQLRQRIQISCHIKPLREKEVEAYVLRRLERAGNRNAVTFGEGTFTAAFQYTRGVPRLINILFDFLLLDAYAMDSRAIDAKAVHEVAKDLSFESQYWNTPSEEDSVSAKPSHQTEAAPANHPPKQMPAASVLQRHHAALQQLSDRVQQLEQLDSARPDDALIRLESQWKEHQSEQQQQVQGLWRYIETLQHEINALRESHARDEEQSSPRRAGFFRRLLWGK